LKGLNTSSYSLLPPKKTKPALKRFMATTNPIPSPGNRIKGGFEPRLTVNEATIKAAARKALLVN